MSIEVIKTPEHTIVVPATYDINLKLTQEQLDWFHSLCGSISGNIKVTDSRFSATSPLREITDKLYENLGTHVKHRVNITRTHWVGSYNKATGDE